MSPHFIRPQHTLSTQCRPNTHEYSLKDTITGELFGKQQQQQKKARQKSQTMKRCTRMRASGKEGKTEREKEGEKKQHQ